MNRRSFLSTLGALPVAIATPKTVAPQPRTPVGPTVQPATGSWRVVGVALKPVQAGDLVEIVTHGQVAINVTR